MKRPHLIFGVLATGLLVCIYFLVAPKSPIPFHESECKIIGLDVNISEPAYYKMRTAQALKEIEILRYNAPYAYGLVNRLTERLHNLKLVTAETFEWMLDISSKAEHSHPKAWKVRIESRLLEFGLPYHASVATQMDICAIQNFVPKVDADSREAAIKKIDRLERLVRDISAQKL